MNKLYLVVLSFGIDRDKLTGFLDTRSEIQFWFYNLPNSIFIRSNISAQALSRLIESHTREITHIVVEVSECFGRLPAEHWKYIR